MIYSGSNGPKFKMNRFKLLRRFVLCWSLLLNIFLLCRNEQQETHEITENLALPLAEGRKSRVYRAENVLEVIDPGLAYENVEKTFQLSILHVFEPFGNEDLGRNVRQGHRQNYRNLAIRYPHIELNVIYVYTEVRFFRG